MLSFHNDPAVKAKYLARVRAHAAADELVHGYYWSEGKGCAVGCTVEVGESPHGRYPIDLGLPVWLAYLEDSLFESLPNGEAKAWPVRFLEAIPVGVDLELVQPRFLKWLLTDEKEGILRLVDGKKDTDDKYTTKVRASIIGVSNLMDEWAITGVKPARSAASSASSAASSASSAAWSAAWSAQAERLLALMAAC